MRATPTSTPATTSAGTSASAWRAHTGAFAWPTFLLALGCAASFAAVWWAVLAGALSLAAGFAINTVVVYLAFTPMHEAAHGNVAGRHKSWRWVDGAVGWVCSTMFAAPYPAFRVIHLRHHGTTNDLHEDPDAWVAGSNPLSIFARCFSMLFHYYASILAGPIRRTKAGAEVRTVSVLTLAVFGLITAGLIAAGLGWHALALWWGPALVASGVLAFFFDWLPHYPHTQRGRYVDTRAIVAPRVVGWALLQQNLHLVHHLYPRVPFYAYGQVFVVMRGSIERGGSEIVQWPGAYLPAPSPTAPHAAQR